MGLLVDCLSVPSKWHQSSAFSAIGLQNGVPNLGPQNIASDKNYLYHVD